MITVEHLTGGYGKKPIIRDLQFEIRKGEFFALLGPNGSGKSTIFKLITGQLPITSGSILIDGKPMSQLTKLEKARKVAVLAQESQVTFDFTVEEIVSLGRYPHQTGLFKRLSPEDKQVIEDVMHMTRIEQFRSFQFRTLSGGEKQRVLLAKALAQQPEVLLLDEPTNHLDIKHTFQILTMLKKWQRSKDLTIFAILHDLNVASLYADRVALLHKGNFLEVGDVNILRKENQLKKVYEVDVKTQAHPVVAKPQLLMTPMFEETDASVALIESFFVDRKEDHLIVHFTEPLRTISNAAIGSGIQWFKHFCLMNQPSAHTSREQLKTMLEKYGIPPEQASIVICSGNLNDAFIMERQLNGVDILLITAFDEAVHLLLFIDAPLDDRTLFDFYMAATEAKAAAFQRAGIPLETDRQDSLVIAANLQHSLPGEAIESISRGQIGQLILSEMTETLLQKVGK
ncbi:MULTISPECIES: ATP-binding cassette domain-containing protein [Sporosarcina]|uniref:ATP-binding cassette domain-containing protein n=1 Tax=Sporosarcina contaminans TaxID=633403 RepID=A0ABW3TZ55_9BACL